MSHTSTRSIRSRGRRDTRRGLIALLAGLSVGAMGPGATGLAAQVATDSELVAAVDSIFSTWDNQDTPGCAVAVDQGPERILSRAWGMANLEHGVPNTPETIFENGSVSKQFTAAAVVLLAMEGKLSLEDDVRTYVPELPDYGHPVTLRHLLNHTSGLRDWGSVAGVSGWGRSNRTHNHDHVLDILTRQTALNFEPGFMYSYSNSGYNLLAIVVSRVAGMPFAEFSTERIFEPLGMEDTEWRDDYRRIVPGRSVGYAPARSGGYRIDHPIENVHGNGGLLTTVDDLLTWNRSLNEGSLAGPELVAMMETQGVLNDGTTISYALGLDVGSIRGTPSVSHGGATNGYRAFLARYPERDLSVALLCNASNANPGALASAVAIQVLGEETLDPAPEPPAGVELPRDLLERRAGIYRDLRTGTELRLRLVTGGRLLRGRTELVPLSEREFHVGASGLRAVWDEAPDGERSGFRILDGERVVDAYAPEEPVELWTLNLEDYAGSFHSADAETTLTFTLEDDGIVVFRRPDDRGRLRPSYRDAFFGPGGFLRFIRDESGRVVEVSLYQSRIHDLRFQRVRDGG